MSRTPQTNPFADEVEPAIQAEPGSNYTPDYREFFGRLRRARIDRGLSIADMSDEVGIGFELAYEFENLAAPLPFECLEVWCQTVGVPFGDYLVVYWANEEAYAAAKVRQQSEAQERESQEEAALERQSNLSAPCITDTDAGASALNEAEATAPELPSVNRRGVFSASLCFALDRIAKFFRSPFSTPKEKSE